MLSIMTWEVIHSKPPLGALHNPDCLSERGQVPLPSTHCCWKLVGVPVHVDFQLWRPSVLVPNKTYLSKQCSFKVDPGRLLVAWPSLYSLGSKNWQRTPNETACLHKSCLQNYCCFWFFWRIQKELLSNCFQAKFNQISNQPLILNFLLWVILLFYPADCPLPPPRPLMSLHSSHCARKYTRSDSNLWGIFVSLLKLRNSEPSCRFDIQADSSIDVEK